MVSIRKWLIAAGALLMISAISASCGTRGDERVDTIAACTGTEESTSPDDVVAAASQAEANGDEVAACVLAAAGEREDSLPPEWADAIERIVVERPLVLVQPHAADNPALSGIPIDPVGARLNSDLVANMLETIFRSGEGDLLTVFRDAIVPLHVDLWLEAGIGPEEVETGYLGQIDGRISQASGKVHVDQGRTVAVPNDETRPRVTVALRELARRTFTWLPTTESEATITDTYLDQAVERSLEVVAWGSTVDGQSDAASIEYGLETAEDEVWLHRLALTIAQRNQMVLAPDNEPAELVDPEDVFEYLFADSGAYRTVSFIVLPFPASDEVEALAWAEAGHEQLATLADWDRSFLYFYRAEQNQHDRVASPTGP